MAESIVSVANFVDELVSRWRDGSKAEVLDKLSRHDTGNFMRPPNDAVGAWDARYAYNLLSKFLAAFAAPNEADAILDDLIEKYPRCRHALLLLASKKVADGDVEEAVRLINLTLSIVFDDLFAQDMLLRAYRLSPESARAPWVKAGEANLKGRFCHKPFTHFETTPSGDIFVCCPSYLPVSIGNIYKSSWDEIWNSPVAQELRRSIHDGDYAHCSRLSCPAIQADSLPRTSAALDDAKNGLQIGDLSPTPTIETIEKRLTDVQYGPAFVNLSHDRSCNLSCPSCRTQLIIAKKSEQASFDVIVDTVVLPALKQARRVWITGSGDPFASKHFRDILGRLNREEYPDLTVDLQTNGQLFTPGEWDKLARIHPMIGEVYVSIDAAQEETYSDVRRGGTFDRVLENMDFIAGLRKSGYIRRLGIAFVVQAQNFREMPDFVNMGKKWGVDFISFSRIRQWGTYSESEFSQRNIFDPLHPQHDAFRTLMQSPVLKEPFVWLANVSSFT